MSMNTILLTSIDKDITCGLWLAAIRRFCFNQQTQPEGRKPQAAGHVSITSNEYTTFRPMTALYETENCYRPELKSEKEETLYFLELDVGDDALFIP